VLIRYVRPAVSAALVAGFAVAAHEARAQDFGFAYLGGDPGPAAPYAAPIGSWSTTVTRTPVAARDTSWSATTVATASARMAAGSLDETVTRYYRPAGAPLTGQGHSLSGKASYYWQDQMTATGERFNKRALTAAHKTLPFGTRVRVTRLDTGNSVVVRINDRGPFKAGRVIDLSERAAEEIGMTGVGVTPVKLEVLGQ
jgi:rare lipoprotein A